MELIAPAVLEQHYMVVNKRPRYVPDVTGKIPNDRGQGAELDHRDRRSQLFRSKRQIHHPAAEHQVRRRTNGYEFSQSLDNAEQNSLKKGHYKLDLWILIETQDHALYLVLRALMYRYRTVRRSERVSARMSYPLATTGGSAPMVEVSVGETSQSTEY